MSADLTRQTAATLADMIASGEVSFREVTQAHLNRIAAVDGSVHAFLHVSGELALAQADAVDRAIAAGDDPGAGAAGAAGAPCPRWPGCPWP
ncbi:MAG: hypothetical protein U0R72_17130 [Nakamurella multipartita]